ncbi:MAG: phosphate/phosphite/phosphonate ABC transporter substrate-binding protein [Sphaerospermopsis sp. SIO1G2]|nr:phosphate/phosphite/phosphonate ABC transporter substrate-binding protein [Sphaerospermopsis sp. SIO1G1]NET74175.1 phosphate/phosphite/phosphonate ABC transporter substrate-binding protein [Sphaerospermopsis sp. SIO1G2]
MQRRKLLLYSLLFMMGCTSGVKVQDQLAITQLNNLKLAVTDVIGIEDLKRDYGDLRRTLETVLRIPVELFPVDNYTAAVPALLSGNVDMVFAGPSEYLILQSRAKAIPVIAVNRVNYHSIIVVRADSDIKSVAQLKNKTIAMRQVGSTSGHIFPTKLLMDGGLDPNTDINIVMLGDKGVLELKNKVVDAWATSSDKYDNILASEGLSAQDFSILVKSNLLPSDVFVVSNQLAPNLIEKLRMEMINNQEKILKSLVAAATNYKYKDAKIVQANDSDYDTIREVYTKIGQGNYLQ